MAMPRRTRPVPSVAPFSSSPRYEMDLLMSIRSPVLADDADQATLMVPVASGTRRHLHHLGRADVGVVGLALPLREQRAVMGEQVEARALGIRPDRVLLLGRQARLGARV